MNPNPSIFSTSSTSQTPILPTRKILWRFLVQLAGIVGIAPAPSFGQGSERISLALGPSGKVWNATWQSSPGETYFLQYSSDLRHWEYVPKIYSGTGGLIQSSFILQPNCSFFVRRISTDQFSSEAAISDFDNDGLANIVELQHGTDPFNANSGPGEIGGIGMETVGLKLFSSNFSSQTLSNGQVLSSPALGSATVALGGSAKGEITPGGFIWTNGVPGSYRGFLSQSNPIPAGRAVIASFKISSQADMCGIMGFTQNGALSGLTTSGSMSLFLQRTASNSYNRLVSTSGSGNQWTEMTQVISPDVEYRAMLRKETDGFSSWIQGGMFASMGARVNSAVWFPVARWRGVNPTVSVKAGLYNSWVGPTWNSEFSDIKNPAMDATSALLDYGRNKNGLHVPSLLALPDGRILAAWQNATFHETNDCQIRLAVRDRRGVWKEAATVIGAGADGESNNGPVLHQAGSQIWLTYQSKVGPNYSVRKRLVSDDVGTISLSTPVTLFNNGLLLNHSLTLPSGRIIACWHTQDSIWKNRISFSDDNGLTWISANMPEFQFRAGEGFAIIEADGTLASYWRTDRTAIYRSTSNDNGATWTALASTTIPCANMPSQGLMGSRVCGFKRPSDGKIVLIGNNSITQREKLTAWLVNNGVVEGEQSLLPWDVPDGSAEGLHYPDLIVHPDDSMTVIFARWLGGGLGSSELHSAINTFLVPAAFN